jgi:hypothetical protein
MNVVPTAGALARRIQRKNKAGKYVVLCAGIVKVAESGDFSGFCTGSAVYAMSRATVDDARATAGRIFQWSSGGAERRFRLASITAASSTNHRPTMTRLP